VGGVDGALEDLGPVGLDVHLHDRDMGLGRGRERGALERRHPLPRSHPRPDETTRFVARIGDVLHFLAEIACRGLGRHLQDVAGHVHFPAVVQAAQPALLVAPQREGRAAMGTALVQHAEASLAVAEHHQVLAEDARVHRRAVVLLHLLGKAHRHPVAAEDAPHHGIALDAAQQVVVLGGEHRMPPVE
jgi:hypothetical protein